MTKEQPSSTPAHVPAEIQPGDPRLRRQVLFVLGAACLLAVVGVLLLERRLNELQEISSWDVEQAANGMYNLAEPILRGIGIGAVLIGLWCCWIAVCILRSSRFPAPGTRVLRDTLILRGIKARRRGLGALVLGLVLLALGIWYPPRGLARVERTLIHAITMKPTQVSSLPDTTSNTPCAPLSSC